MGHPFSASGFSLVLVHRPPLAMTPRCKHYCGARAWKLRGCPILPIGKGGAFGLAASLRNLKPCVAQAVRRDASGLSTLNLRPLLI